MVQKTAVAMSGGVDSSAAAVLLQGEGRALTGLTLTLFPGEGDAPADAARALASLEKPGQVSLG